MNAKKFITLGYSYEPFDKLEISALSDGGENFQFENKGNGVYENSELPKRIQFFKTLTLRIEHENKKFIASASIINPAKVYKKDTTHVKLIATHTDKDSRHFYEHGDSFSPDAFYKTEWDSATRLAIVQLNSEFEYEIQGGSVEYNAPFKDRGNYHRLGLDVHVMDVTSKYEKEFKYSIYTGYMSSTLFPLKEYQTMHHRIIATNARLTQTIIPPRWIATSHFPDDNYEKILNEFQVNIIGKRDYLRFLGESDFYLETPEGLDKTSEIDLFGTFGVMGVTYMRSTLKPIRYWNPDTCLYPGKATNTIYTD